MASITITQYNTHLFHGTGLGFLPEFEDELRIKDIILQLRKSRSDIICLEEVWADATKNIIANELRSKFPHSYYNKTSFIKIGSGLLLLSKWNIIRPSFTQYIDLVGSDNWSQKGFIQADIVHDTKILIRLLFTHTQAGVGEEEVKTRRSNFAQLYTAIRSINLSDKKPLLVAGDLNVIAELIPGAPAKEYKEICNNFGKLGLVDVYRIRNPDVSSNHGFTYNGPRNKLIPIFEKADYNKQERLDYIFINKDAAKITIDSANVSWGYLYTSPKNNGLMDLSDHYPLIASLSWL